MGLNKLAAAALASAFVIATAGIGYAQSSSTGGKASTSSSMGTSKPSGGTTGLERAEESGSTKGMQEKQTHGKAFQREEKSDTTSKDKR